MQNILDTPPADQRQHSAENSAQCPRANSPPAGTGNLSNTPTAGDARKPAHISRLPGAGAAPLRSSSAIRTIPAHVLAQPGITENTESVVTSARPPGHNAHHCRHASKLTREGELRQDDADEYHRVRDGDQPAATWCSDRGEFVPATGPPCGALQQHQQPARRYRVQETRKVTS